MNEFVQSDGGTAKGHKPDAPVKLADCHQRLLEGDPAVPSILAEELLFLLMKRLVSYYPKVDPHVISDAVTDALLAYFQKPDSYKTTCSMPLERLLVKKARCRIRNWIRSENRRLIRENDWAHLNGIFFDIFVELRIPADNMLVEDDALHGELIDEFKRTIIDPLDWEVFCLWLNGERRSLEFARLLGVSNLALPDQRKVVKRSKDRILKKLKRWITVRDIPG
jgi:hypothetical protein